MFDDPDVSAELAEIRQRYIAGSAKCSIKPLSQILTRILTAYTRSGVNQMYNLKNSKELLENLKTQSLHSVKRIKSFAYSLHN